MKLISFLDPFQQRRIGLIQDNKVIDFQLGDEKLPNDMLTLIDGHDFYLNIIKSIEKMVPHYLLKEVTLLPPLPNPRSFRDYIGFEMHMLNASKSFGHQVGEAWYEMPIFYFTNHQAIYGTGEEITRPAKETKLDIELELACIIGKKGKNIQAKDADDYIFGYTIFNDWTARAIQKREMEIPLGPHKGKDFANAIGPCIITKDEMEQYRTPFNESDYISPLKIPIDRSDRFDLKMTSRINGITICEGNYKSAYWSFAAQIQRAAENNVTLMPGDILGSGTVGWGSLIENNFTVHRPLEPGDIVELEIEGIGILTNRVV